MSGPSRGELQATCAFERNTFTRNVTAENDQYGYRFDAPVGPEFDLVLPVLQPDGETRNVDIRSIPFVRFDDNEAHSESAYGINLRGVEGRAPRNEYGTDREHPFVVRRMNIWNVHFGFRPESRYLLLEDVAIARSNIGIYEPSGTAQVFRRLAVSATERNDVDRAGPVAPSTFSVLVDDARPTTVITHVLRVGDRVVVRGTTADNAAPSSAWS